MHLIYMIYTYELRTYFSLGMGPTSYNIYLKYIPTIYKYQSSLTGLPYRSMGGASFTKLIILYLTILGIT